MNRISLAALLAVSTLAGACGTGSADKQSGSRDDQRGLQFARCMREHGVDVPDPKPGQGGGISFRVKAGKPGQGAPAPANLNSAMQACRKYAPNGGRAPSAAQQQEMLAKTLRFARCMRKNGVNFPDPKPQGGGAIMLGGPGSDFDPSSPRFQKAQRACSSLLPGPPGGGSGPAPAPAGP